MGRNKKLTNLRRLASAAILAVVIFGVFIGGACSASSYTEEEHLQRVSEKVKTRYIDSGAFESFEIYPLYNENDKLEFFLVDFEPQGFVYIKINDDDFCGCYMFNDMYTRDNGAFKNESSAPWVREKWVQENSDDGGTYWKMQYEVDDNGQQIFNYDSHFKVAGIKEEKRYLIKVKTKYGSGYVAAVKRGDMYFNVFSLEMFDMSEIDESKPFAISDIGFGPVSQFGL